MAEALLQAERLCRHYGGLKAVDEVSIVLHRGVLHAVIGTNGAGKSTLINLLSGETAPTEGAIRLRGQEIQHWRQARRARAGLGRSYQRNTLFAEFTVFENCRLAAQAQHPRAWDWWTPAQRCGPSLAAAQEAMERTGLALQAHRIAGTLSHGQKRQLEIAMCLATRPEVLLLDEPLAGMGAEESERMLSLLEALRPDHAILLVEHDMDAVFRVADTLTVMVNGRVIATGSPSQVRRDPQVQRAYLGEDLVTPCAA